MQPTLSKEDTLSHIDYDNKDLDHNDPNLLSNQVSAVSGSITIVAAFGVSLVLDWEVGLSEISIRIVLKTPVGSKSLISVELTPTNPKVKVGGSIDGFKAEAEVSVDFSTKKLTASGEVCAPLVGCKKGSVSVNL